MCGICGIFYRDKRRAIDPDTLSPKEALQALYKLKAIEDD